MYLDKILKEKKTDFIDVCRAHHVDKLYAFGSSITPYFNVDKSDIDLLVSVNIANPLDRGDALLSLWDKLEFIFNRKVDLLTENSVRNPILDNAIRRTKKLIYDGEGEKIVS